MLEEFVGVSSDSKELTRWRRDGDDASKFGVTEFGDLVGMGCRGFTKLQENPLVGLSYLGIVD